MRGFFVRTALFVVVAAAFLAVLNGCAKKQAAVMEEPTTQTTPPPTPPPAPPSEPVENPDAWMSKIKDVFFDYDKYDLRADARQVLSDDAQMLKDHSAKLVLEGHCDERGTDEYNLALGQRRADAVKNYLADLGVSPASMSTVSYGEERPFAQGHDEAAWAQNRRVHFLLK
jgi:peptidoglycan-associated lipoprotein